MGIDFWGDKALALSRQDRQQGKRHTYRPVFHAVTIKHIKAQQCVIFESVLTSIDVCLLHGTFHCKGPDAFPGGVR